VTDCDFIPHDYHLAADHRRAVRLRAMGVGCVALMMLVWFGAHHQELGAAHAMLTDIQAQQQQVRIHLDRKGALVAERAHLDEHRDLLAALGDRARLVVVFADLSRRLPNRVVLTRFGVDRSPAVPAPDPAAPAPAGKAAEKTALEPELTPRLRVSGVAVTTSDILEFAAELEKSPLFDRVDVNITGPAQWNRRRVQGFELDCDLVRQMGGAP
jgi:Tfp pilus assembly protein PilN